MNRENVDAILIEADPANAPGQLSVGCSAFLITERRGAAMSAQP